MLTAGIILLSIVVALLAIPVRLRFHTSWPDVTQNDIALEWAFGLIRIRIPSDAPPSSTVQESDSEPKNEHLPRSSGTKPNVLAAFRLKAFRRRIIQFVRDVWHAVHKEDVNLRVRVGLGDPATMGQLWGIFYPLIAALDNDRSTSLVIEPEFVEPIFEAHGKGNIRLVPLQLIYLVASLAFSAPIWAGLRQMRAT